MTVSTQRIRAVITRSLAVTLMTMVIIGMAVTAWAATGLVTWTQQDLGSATKVNIDVVTEPGSYMIGAPRDFVTTATITCLTPTKIYSTGVDRSTIAVIDPVTKSVTATIPLPNPAAGVVYNSKHNKLYVGQYQDSKVLVFDVATDQLVKTLMSPTVGNGAYAAVYNSVTDKVYISNTGDKTVSILNGDTDTLLVPTMTIAAGATTASFDEKRVYFTGKGNQYVTVIDAVQDRVEQNVQIEEVLNLLGGAAPGNVGLRVDAKGRGIAAADDIKLSWDYRCSAPKQKIEFQVRMADDLAGLNVATYYGPDGSNTEWFGIECADGANVAQTATVDLNMPYKGAAELQSKLSSDGLTTPVVQQVRFRYNMFIDASVPAGGGSISPQGRTPVLYGDTQRYDITPQPCYHVVDVMVDGVSKGAVSSYTFENVTASHTISATFAINTYVIDPVAGPGGSILPSGPVTVYCGDSQTFTIQPAACYHVADVIVDGVSKGALSSYTFDNVNANHTIAANFAINTYPITASAGPYGRISPEGTVQVPCGGSQAFQFLPDPGARIASVTVDGTEIVPPPTSYTFANVTVPHTISVTFAGVGASGTLNVSDFFSIYQSGSGTVLESNYYDGEPSWSIFIDGVAMTNCSYLESDMNFGMQVIDSDTLRVTGRKTETVRVGKATIASHGSTVGAAILKGEGNQLVFYDANNVRLGDITFTAVPWVNITASAGQNGSISYEGVNAVNVGSSRTFTMLPSTGFIVSDVLVDGVSVGAVSSYTFNNITVSHTISATFARIEITGTLDISDFFSTSASGDNSIFYSNYYDGEPSWTIMAKGIALTNVYLESDVNFGMQVVDSETLKVTGRTTQTLQVGKATVTSHGVTTSGAATLKGEGNQLVFYNSNNVRLGDITFTAAPWVTITATAGANGYISPSGDNAVNVGGTRTFTISPSMGYHVANVVVDGVSVGAVTSYTFSNVTARHIISATFTR